MNDNDPKPGPGEERVPLNEPVTTSEPARRIEQGEKSVELGESFGVNKLPDGPPPAQAQPDPIPGTQSPSASSDPGSSPSNTAAPNE